MRDHGYSLRTRVSKGTKDYDTFTSAERDAIGTALTNDKTGMYPLTMEQKDTGAFRDYSAGMALGGLSAYVTLWHISPKHPTLLNYLKVSIESCVDQGEALTDPKRKEIADGLKGFAKFKDMTLDEAAVRGVAKQIEATLMASVPVKYRWTPVSK